MSREDPIETIGLSSAPRTPSVGTVAISQMWLAVVGNDVNRKAPPAQTSRPPKGRARAWLSMVLSPCTLPPTA